jgi:mono/diheme cytochrome c family protein
MSVSNAGRRALLIIVVAAAALGSCFAQPNGSKGAGGMLAAIAGAGTDATAGVSEGGAANVCVARVADANATCNPVKSAEPLYSTLVKDEPQDTVVFVDDLFVQFKANCGACHVDTNLGKMPFQANAQNFYQKVGQKVIDAIKSDVETCADGQADCLDFMPPRSANGKPWSEREKDKADPLHLFVDELESWLASKKPDDTYPPADVFILPASKGGKSAYPIDEDFAKSLTNLGTCIPDAGMVATEPSKACDLDAAFADMKRDPMSDSLAERIGLPLSLTQTDLFTLDTAELARYGVIAYQPTYPLWTDDAGKLRYIRVPRGASVKYDKDSKTFDIPENTRFYKTFLKKVIALDGKERYRKIETRVIVSRQGTDSLFGTYEWNDEETQATLVTSPLRNGEPFTDVLKTIVIDEPKAAIVKAQKDAGEISNYTYGLDQERAVRRYAIPGRERCIQCHMGNEHFILGFSPLQVNRRPCDKDTLDAQGFCEGGTLYETGEDELTQLERLISYGVITGMTADDIPKLEEPQGTPDALRNVRTPEELVAQGYMLGNCAHCHNPIGYPTMSNPELKDLLNFLPVNGGGIFEFPLERYSPRIKRGAGGDIQLPYITPSLRDIIPAGDAIVEKWTQKKGKLPGSMEVGLIDAPWRSLIYRNVDTPFTYTDNYAIYPHMPLNSPGFDCRAPRLLGQWMVSIPALKKHPELSEDLPTGDPFGAESDPQPYVEVKPGEPNYALGQEQAKKRLATYRKGERFAAYCPDTGDIVDLDVLRGKRITPIDGSWRSGTDYVLPLEGVPDHPHWVVTDLTEAPGDWTPRRTDWKSVIVDQVIPPVTLKPGEFGYDQEVKARDAQIELVAMLQHISVTDKFKAFGLKKIPFGIWEADKHNCTDQLANVPKLGDYQRTALPEEKFSDGPRYAEHMRWMDVVDPSNSNPGQPIFESTPGQAIFNMICVNCHGPNADSKGRQASTLQDMTGGTGRVANFRSGLFGPEGSGGANRMRVFGSDEIASRYLPWMALGGTKTKIPQAILDLVNQTPVLGERRLGTQPVSSANMLQVAQELCKGVVRLGTWHTLKPGDLRDRNAWEDLHANSGLIVTNGDAELWEQLCSFDNPAPVHVLRVAGTIIQNAEADLFEPSKYPAGKPIGDRFGSVAAQLTPDNTFPWCVATPTDPVLVAWLATQKASQAPGDDKPPPPLPECPPGFDVEENRLKSHFDNTDGWSYQGVETWSTRGAVNAGLAVFVYLDWLVSQNHPIPPRFNECELFKP